MIEVLVAYGGLVSEADGLALATDRAAMRTFPQDAAAHLLRAFRTCFDAARFPGFSKLIDYFVRASGRSGSGGTWVGPEQEQHARESARRSWQDRLERLRWDRDALVAEFSEESRGPAAVLVDYAISSTEGYVERLSSTPDAAPRTSGARTEPPDRTRGRFRSPAKEGFIYFNDAVTRFGVPKSTLHDLVVTLPSRARITDPDSGQVQVEEKALRELLAKRNRTQR
jgi:hypothetical protein